MSWNGFSFNQDNDSCDCPKCRGVQEIEFLKLDIEIEDPQDILDDYFEYIKEARNEEELYGLLTSFFTEVSLHTHKIILLEQVKGKIDLLNDLEFGEFE